MENKRKRILLIASRPLDNDGLTKIEMEIMQYNVGIIEFEVACGFGFDNSVGNTLKTNGIVCYELPNKKKVFLYMAAIQKLVKHGMFDAVYIHGNSAMMFFEALPCKMGGAKVITHCHSTRSDFPIIHHLVKPLFNMIVDEKIGCSLLASKWAYSGRNITTIVNGVDINQFRYDGKKRKEIRASLGWNMNKIVGHIGRFSKEKNHKKLLKIFSEMYKRDDKMRLLLIGDGELKEDINQQISDLGLEGVVSIICYTDCPQDYMQAMDVMVLPSLHEGLCLVAIEAQANGLPVLISSCFPNETQATNIVTRMDLSLPESLWAEKAAELMNQGRHDVVSQLYDKQMDKNDMMSKIQKILLR